MQQNYLWAGQSPDPAPAGYASLQSFFTASLFTGNASTPADRWSYLADSVQYARFFNDGQTLGYGIFVNGLEGVLPLRIRYVEPNSPAATLGLVRGDILRSLNGVSDATLLASGNLSALTPLNVGDVLTLQVERNAVVSSVQVSAAIYNLQPVTGVAVFTQPGGTKVGYLSFKDFITQGEAPLNSAIASFRAAGVRDVVLDLRYNGGGYVSTANLLASLLAGQANSGDVFAKLVFNANLTSRNTSYLLSASTPGFDRAVVITGARTCSASELVVNGLKPYMQVATIGATSCGKPVGFTPVDSCGKTVSAVNFESFNKLDVGRYYNGIPPTCPAGDTFTGVLGDAQEPLTSAALSYLSSGVCPVAGSPARGVLRATPGAIPAPRPLAEPFEPGGMRTP